MNDHVEFIEIFPWNKNFETGIDQIDEQHKQLVHILNQLATHLASRSTPIVLNKIFDELADYADYHFKTEEKIWKSYFKDDDEWYEKHEHTHESFIDKVIALKKEEENKPLDQVIQEIVSFLSHWLAFHILDSDKRMAKVVKAIDANKSIEQAKILAEEEMSGLTRTLINTVLNMYDNLSHRTLELMREKSLRMRAERELQASEERWDFILEGSSESVWDWSLEQDKEYYSKNSHPLLEKIEKKSHNTSRKSRIHPDDILKVETALQEHLDGKTDFYQNKHRVLRENGSWSWVISRGKVINRDKNGKALRMVGTHTDITERQLANAVYQHSSQAMFVTDINNAIISINPAFTRITGYSEKDIIGKNPRILSSGLHDKLFYQNMWESINNTGFWQGEIWNKRKNGDIYPEEINITSIKDTNGLVDHRVALFYDITDKKESDRVIVEQANFDSLTKLPNRRMFNDRVQQAIRKSNRTNQPFALLFIDLDRFKDINDSLGHELGDHLLKEASQRIISNVRETDTIARIGGDEFTVILPDFEDTINIDRIATNIIKSLSEPFQLALEKAYISASIGISLFPSDAQDSASLLRHADQAMYRAKTSGKCCFKYFTPSMQQEAQNRQEQIIELHQAIALDQFQLHYQPIVDLNTLEIKKFEALIRWNHPSKGIINPKDFIPIAEKIGLIREIGNWVFKESVNQTKKWITQYDKKFKISINMSPAQFQNKNILNNWLAYIEEIDLAGGHIVIEITESLLLENESKVFEQLIEFRNAQIGVALDDFGVGYSSLSRIKELDIDYIKIDRSFIQNLTPDSQDIALCEAIIVMAHKLNIKVIAEGIESPLQYKLLLAMGCDYGQGFLFSRPVPADDTDKIFAKADFKCSVEL